MVYVAGIYQASVAFALMFLYFTCEERNLIGTGIYVIKSPSIPHTFGSDILPGDVLRSVTKSSFKLFITKQLLRSNSFRALLLDVYVLPKISYLFEFSSFPSGCLPHHFMGNFDFSLNFIPNALGQTFYQVRSLQHHTI